MLCGHVNFHAGFLYQCELLKDISVYQVCTYWKVEYAITRGAYSILVYWLIAGSNVSTTAKCSCHWVAILKTFFRNESCQKGMQHFVHFSENAAKSSTRSNADHIELSVCHWDFSLAFLYCKIHFPNFFYYFGHGDFTREKFDRLTFP